MLSVADHAGQIPEPEIKRLQIQLKTILKHSGKNLKQLLKRAYQKTGLLEQDLPLLVQALQAFGSLRRSAISEQEWLRARNVPWLVWLDESQGLLCEEAIGSLLKERGAERSQSLLQHLLSLPGRERRAWSQWLQWETIQPYALYRQLGKLRTETGFLPVPECPAYLDQIFLPDQLFWFQKGVLPFYATMNHLEKQELRSDQRAFLLLFKQGYLLLREETTFGQELRYRVERSEEFLPGGSIPGEARIPLQQQMLF